MAEITKSNLEKYLSILASEIKELVQELHLLFLGVFPDFVEVILWENLRHQTREKRYISAISPHKARVTMHFWCERELQDPEVCFRGIVKKLIHVKIQKLRDIKLPP